MRQTNNGFVFSSGRLGSGPESNQPHNPEWWNDVAVPEYIRNQGQYWNDNSRNVKLDYFASNFADGIGEFVGSIPYVGGFLKFLSTQFSQPWKNQLTKDYNAMQRAQSLYDNWYNSPAQQVKRLRLAGLNPYQQTAVKSMPASSPTYQFFVPSTPNYPNTFAQDLTALSNYQSMPYKIDNLRSLTDINDFKLNYLLPQLFDKNGYVNNILSLQSAWEDGNYSKERQIKQDLLQAQYMISLAEIGENIIMLSPVDGRTLIDPVRGTMEFEFNDSPDGIPRVLTLNQLTFAEAPIFAQQAFLKTLAIQNGAELSEAQRSYYIDAANNQSMMAALNKFNADKLELYLDTYHRTGVWPNEDPVLRAAAGLMDWEDVWQQGGFNFLTRSADKGVDYVGKYATRGKGASPVRGYSGTRTYRSPSGVKTMDFETNYLY